MKLNSNGFIGLAALLLSASSYAADLASRHYEFPANQGTVLTNPFPWQLAMDCQLNTKADKNILPTVMLKNTGTVNGHLLNEGDHINITIKDNDKLQILIAGSAQVQITNQGTSLVTADCQL